MALTRSQQMSRIRGKNTKPELRLRRALWADGQRYRLQARTPVGRPDIVFLGRKVAVFVDGCFWHGCPDHYVRPRSRADFWATKLRTNVERDRRQTLELEALGWSVVRAWEHEVFEDLDGVVARVRLASQPAPSWRVVRVDPLDDAGNEERRHLELLRDPSACRHVDGPRTTAKWRRPSR